jgi:hypothetical protein
VLLSVTSSPGVKAIALVLQDRALLVHLYSNGAYMAVVSRGLECRIDDKRLKRATWLLARLMERLAKRLKSRYYTFTGELSVEGDHAVYRPYILPSLTVDVILRGNTAVVQAGDFRARYRTTLDLAGVLVEYARLLESGGKC